MNLNLVVLDPAHGGPESGATIGDKVLEKDVTLALAAKLRASLGAAGFTVISTRDSDGPDPLTTDQRAEMANPRHPLACLVLHATASGSGVHVYTSTLATPLRDPDAEDTGGFVPTLWDAAQAPFVPQSTNLAAGMMSALGAGNLAARSGTAPLRPLNSLMCPAVAIELAPLGKVGDAQTPASDGNYQQQVANAAAGALRAWRDRVKASEAADAAEPSLSPLRKAMAAAQAISHAAAQNPGGNRPAASRVAE